jgi:hypothetical protein
MPPVFLSIVNILVGFLSDGYGPLTMAWFYNPFSGVNLI